MKLTNPNMGKKPKTDTNKFIRELREYIPMVYNFGFIQKKDEKEFKKNFLGVYDYAHWYVGGIRVCYKTILKLLQKIEELYNRNKELERQINDFLKGK